MLKPLIKKIVVAVNGSQQSIHAAMYGILLAKQLGCTLKAVYVVDTTTLKQLTLARFFVSDESSSYEQALIEEGRKYLAQVAAFSNSKDVKIETELRKGAVWAEVVKSAEDFDADLILLGGSDHSYLPSDKISQIYSEITCHASCNVMVVHKKDIEKLFELA